MQDDPTVFLKKIVTITVVLALILAGVLYFSRPDSPSEEVATAAPEGSQPGVYQSDLDSASDEEADTETGSTGGSAATTKSNTTVKRSLPRSSTSVTLSSDPIRRAEQTAPVASTIVYYDATGFHPANFIVAGGTSVRFINRGNLSMRVSSVIQAGAPVYPEFDQVRSVGRGGYYDFTFSKKGSWSFTNQGAPQHFGTITVI
ncbi:MAG TPA: hypothetical protein VD967_01895 [Candidatus Paceibacterota bacterium]|nr:hypothetical protein [Candidatus Paceibacterota bacterium]